MAWLYRYPGAAALAPFPLAIPQALNILACWLRAGVLEPLLLFPGLLAARFAYALGMTVGGLR